MSYFDRYKMFCKELNFKELRSIKKDFEHGYFIVQGELNRRDVLLKIIPATDTKRAEYFFKESLIDKILNKHNDNIELPLIIKTNVITYGHNNVFCWIIRRYYKGRSLARYVEGRPLRSADLLRPIYLHKTKYVTDKIVSNLRSIQSLETDLRKLATRKQMLKRRYPENIDQKALKIISKDTGVNLSSQVDLFTKNKKDYFAKQNITASIGDLTPANVILKDDGQLLFSDFELFSFDNYTIDPTYLWLFLSRYPNWQNYLISKTIKNKQDKLFFQLSLIRILFKLYRAPFDSDPNKTKEDENDYFKTHKWIKYLVVAGDSFEAIMKVK